MAFLPAAYHTTMPVPVSQAGAVLCWMQVLDTENPDLFKYLTTQLEAPSPLRVGAPPARLRDDCLRVSVVSHVLATTAQENAAFQELAGWVDGKSLLTQR